MGSCRINPKNTRFLIRLTLPLFAPAESAPVGNRPALGINRVEQKTGGGVNPSPVSNIRYSLFVPDQQKPGDWMLLASGEANRLHAVGHITCGRSAGSNSDL